MSTCHSATSFSTQPINQSQPVATTSLGRNVVTPSTPLLENDLQNPVPADDIVRQSSAWKFIMGLPTADILSSSSENSKGHQTKNEIEVPGLLFYPTLENQR